MSFIIFIHILYIHTHSTYMYIHSYIVFYIHTCMHVHVGNLNSKVKHFLTELKNLLHIIVAGLIIFFYLTHPKNNHERNKK